jgi:hypothetical protein
MRRVIAFSAAALLLVITVALPQQNPATGTIEGTVVRADNGEPISGATITLAVITSPAPGVPTVLFLGELVALPPTASDGTAAVSSPRAGTPTSTTTADGTFVFNNLDARTYRVFAAANGFARQEHGQRAMNGPGRALHLDSGESIKNASIRLPAAGTVSGRISDESGAPAMGAPVQLIRPLYYSEGRTVEIVGSAFADDRGEYRLYGVPPGRYYLVAGTVPGSRGRPPQSRARSASYFSSQK